MRLSLVATATLMALSACTGTGSPQGPGSQSQASGERQRMSLATPMGSGAYQNHMRARENAGRSGIPFSVPPERTTREQDDEPRPWAGQQGAPLSAPMREQATAARGDERDNDSAAQSAARPEGASGRDTTLADQQPFDPDRPRDTAASQLAPGQGENTAPIPLVRVRDASADDGPNIIAYALNTNHPVGTERYSRRNPLRWQAWERNCLRYNNQDAAQEAFLEAGGPERDRHNLDPVGDGYACWWDPEPIRQAVRGG